MNLYDLQLLLLNRQLRESEIRKVVQDGADNARPIRAVHMELNVRELFFVLGETEAGRKCTWTRSLR